MKINIVLAQLLPYALLAHGAQSTLSETCAGLQNLSGCKFKFSVPTGFTLNKCKTKKKKTILCPTKKEPSKTCDVMTCMSGYDITKKQVPTGLSVVTKQVDLCQAVRKVLGQSEGDKLIKSSEAICKCFPRLQQLSLTAEVKSISEGVISTSNTKVADEIRVLKACLWEGGIATESGVSDAIKSIRANGPAAVAFDVHGCTYITEAVKDVFSRYTRGIGGSFRAALSNWGVLTSLNTTSVELRGAMSNLVLYVPLAQAQVDIINASCEKIVSSNIAAAGYLGNLGFPADLGGKVNNLLQRQADASDQAGDLLDKADTEALFRNGQMKTVKDLFQLVPIIKRLKDLSNDIKTQLDPFKEFLSNNLTFAISAATEENRLGSMGFDEIRQELNVSEKEENREVFEKLEAMQQLILKNQDGQYLARVIGSIGSIQGQLSYLSARNERFVIETGIVSFEQWSRLPTMAMPCSKMVEKTYKYSGFKEVFSYPEYFKCAVHDMTARFPDRQIGYLRWSF
ncbi:hypothetical protein FNAPI_13344 [Fusarium napiforme]|uniref:Uncharacterized protein n=1 Tax=Fusarium napiforme TaxID=42672 RepID=A0A8H5I621_9HYPO|nr:hypothetical protein FNAPI_13344 [Fusarium napiforme]